MCHRSGIVQHAAAHLILSAVAIIAILEDKWHVFNAPEDGLEVSDATVPSKASKFAIGIW